MCTNPTRAVAATRTPEFDHLSAAWSLADDIADRIAIASPAELHDIHRDMWVQHGHLSPGELGGQGRRHRDGADHAAAALD